MIAPNSSSPFFLIIYSLKGIFFNEKIFFVALNCACTMDCTFLFLMYFIFFGIILLEILYLKSSPLNFF